MSVFARRFALLPSLAFLLASLAVPPVSLGQDNASATPPAEKEVKVKQKKVTAPADRIKKPILWEDPGNIASKDLFLGEGGEEHRPKDPFTFVSEDKGGTNPKFDVRDGDGKKWRVKLGSEARPEVVASRLLSAVGYFTEEYYLLPTVTVSGLQLKRGRELVHGDQITDGRFERKYKGKKLGDWRWKDNPFKNSREFNGLRVMMAVMNNWDLKDVNNKVYQDDKHDRQVYLVSDLGATFASNDEHVHHDTDKGNLDSFEHSKFIIKKTDKDVSFGTPMLPGGLLLRQGPILLGETVRRSAMDWIGHDIPLADARWTGSLLGQLTHKQLEDAFRAGDFPEDQRQAFVKLLEQRIAELKAL